MVCACSKEDVSAQKHTTYDAVILCHELTDERLQDLIDMNRNTSWDIALTSLGVVIGFAQNAHTVYVDIASNAPIGQWDAVATVIFVVAFALGAKSFWDWFVGKDDLRKALEELRNRPTKTETIGGTNTQSGT